MFASIILLCLIYDNFLFCCYYCYITMFLLCVLIEFFIASQYIRIRKSRGYVQKYIDGVLYVKFRLCILLTLLSDNISYHFYLCLWLINKDYIHNLQQYHKTPSETTAKWRYDPYDVCIALFNVFLFFYILLLTFWSKIITAICSMMLSLVG